MNTEAVNIWRQYPDGAYRLSLADGFAVVDVEPYKSGFQWTVKGRWHESGTAETLEQAQALGLQKLKELIAVAVKELDGVEVKP